MTLLPKAKNNSFVGNAFYIFLIRFFPTLANFLVLIYFSLHLEKPQYGTYQNFWVQLIVLSTAAGVGLSVWMVSYTPAFLVQLFRSVKKYNYLLLVAWLFIVSFVFASLQSPHVALSLVLLSSFLIVYTISALFETFVIVCKKYKTMAVVNLLYAITFCYIHQYSITHSLSLSVLFTHIFILLFIKLLCIFIVAFRSIKSIVPTSDEINTLELTTAKKLWMHLGFYDVLQRLFSWMDKFIISLFLTQELSAIYFNGSIDIPFLPILLGAAGSAGLMLLAQNNKKTDAEYATHLTKYSARILSAIVFPLFFFLLIYRSEIFSVVFAGRYQQAIPIFFISILVLPLRAYNFTSLLQNHSKGAIINIGAIGDILLAAILMYPLYVWLGLPGVALSYVISTYCQALYYLYHSARLVHQPISHLLPLFNWAMKLILFFFVFIVIHYLSLYYFTPWKVVTLGVVILVISMSITLYIELKKEHPYG